MNYFYFLFATMAIVATRGSPSSANATRLANAESSMDDTRRTVDHIAPINNTTSRPLKVALLGRTGWGKSSTGVKLLTGVDPKDNDPTQLFRTVRSSNSCTAYAEYVHKVTRETITAAHRNTLSEAEKADYVGNANGHIKTGHFLGDSNEAALTVIDTPGFADEGGHDKDTDTMKSICGTLITQKPDAVVFLVDGRQERIPYSTRAMLEGARASLKAGIMKNIIIGVNFWPFKDRSRNERSAEGERSACQNFASEIRGVLTAPFLDGVADPEGTSGVGLTEDEANAVEFVFFNTHLHDGHSVTMHDRNNTNLRRFMSVVSDRAAIRPQGLNTEEIDPQIMNFHLRVQNILQTQEVAEQAQQQVRQQAFNA